MKNCFTNPKFMEYKKDERFVQNLINDRNSAERKEVIKSILSIVFAALIFFICWLAIIAGIILGAK